MRWEKKIFSPSPKKVLATTFCFSEFQVTEKNKDSAPHYGALVLTLAMNFFSLTLLF